MVSCTDAPNKQLQTLDSLTETTFTNVPDASSFSFSDVHKAVSNTDSLRGLLAEYKRVETTQNGVCDTCVTGFVSVLIEHRSVSKQLSDEIQEMRNKLDAVNASNAQAFALINSLQRQSAELGNAAQENIVSLRTIIQENQKQVAELRQRKSDFTSSKVRY
jgi:hypothetical protein